jgi:hypothetical protein
MRAFSKWRMTCGPVCSSFGEMLVDGLEHALASTLVALSDSFSHWRDRQARCRIRRGWRLLQAGRSHCSSIAAGRHEAGDDLVEHVLADAVDGSRRSLSASISSLRCW